MFQNPEIALEDLPGIEELDWQPMDPRFATQQRLVRFIFVAVFTVAATAASFIPAIALQALAMIWVTLLLFAVPMLIWPAISVPKRGYVVRDKDIVYKSGVFWRKVTAIPYNRIQHVETSNTPLDRHYGLATLQIFTAGGTGGDLKIDGLSADTAEILRTFILKKVGAIVEHG